MSNITSNDRGVVQPTNRLVQLPDRLVQLSDRLVQHTRRLVPSEDNQKADKGIITANEDENDARVTKPKSKGRQRAADNRSTPAGTSSDHPITIAKPAQRRRPAASKKKKNSSNASNDDLHRMGRRPSSLVPWEALRKYAKKDGFNLYPKYRDDCCHGFAETRPLSECNICIMNGRGIRPGRDVDDNLRRRPARVPVQRRNPPPMPINQDVIHPTMPFRGVEQGGDLHLTPQLSFDEYGFPLSIEQQQQQLVQQQLAQQQLHQQQMHQEQWEQQQMHQQQWEQPSLEDQQMAQSLLQFKKEQQPNMYWAL